MREAFQPCGAGVHITAVLSKENSMDSDIPPHFRIPSRCTARALHNVAPAIPRRVGQTPCILRKTFGCDSFQLKFSLYAALQSAATFFASMAARSIVVHRSIFRTLP